jgi:hypothetical protein
MLQEVLPYCKCFMSSAGSPRRRWWPSCVRYKCCKSRSGCRLFCNGYTRMLQVSIQKCFIYFGRMLPLASAFIWILYMLQCYTHVLQKVCSKCFICFRFMLQKVLSCCKCFMSRQRRRWPPCVHVFHLHTRTIVRCCKLVMLVGQQNKMQST